MKKAVSLFLLILIPLLAKSQELEVYKTDSVTAVRSFIYLTSNGSWFKSGAVIFSRIKNHNSGKEIYGFAIANASNDSRSREIPEGVTILIKHLDNSTTELYTESGSYSQKEASSVLAAGGRYFAFATTISTYVFSYSCEITKEQIEKIAQWGITKMRVDEPGPGWEDFDLSSSSSPVSDQLMELAAMAKRIIKIDMDNVKPDSYVGF